MVGREIQLANHTDARGGSERRELDAFAGVEQFATGEMAKEVEMPPGAAEFAVGGELQAGGSLLVHYFFDLEVFGLAQLVSRDLAFFQPGARFLDTRRPQQAADRIGAKRCCDLLMVINSRDFLSISSSAVAA